MTARRTTTIAAVTGVLVLAAGGAAAAGTAPWGSQARSAPTTLASGPYAGQPLQLRLVWNERVMSAAATYLGYDGAAALRAALAKGTSLADIATAKGLSVDRLEATVAAQLTGLPSGVDAAAAAEYFVARTPQPRLRPGASGPGWMSGMAGRGAGRARPGAGDCPYRASTA